MTDKLIRRWRSDRHEGLKEYMKTINVNFALRHAALVLTMHEEISRDGDTWSIQITSTFKNHRVDFDINQPFIHHNIDGKSMKTVFTIEGNQLVGTQEAIKDGDVPSRYTREVTPDGEMLQTYVAIPSGVSCKRWFTPCDR